VAHYSRSPVAVLVGGRLRYSDQSGVRVTGYPRLNVANYARTADCNWTEVTHEQLHACYQRIAAQKFNATGTAQPRQRLSFFVSSRTASAQSCRQASDQGE
jgi:hypothetical protein